MWVEFSPFRINGASSGMIILHQLQRFWSVDVALTQMEDSVSYQSLHPIKLSTTQSKHWFFKKVDIEVEIDAFCDPVHPLTRGFIREGRGKLHREIRLGHRGVYTGVLQPEFMGDHQRLRPCRHTPLWGNPCWWLVTGSASDGQKIEAFIVCIFWKFECTAWFKNIEFYINQKQTDNKDDTGKNSQKRKEAWEPHLPICWFQATAKGCHTPRESTFKMIGERLNTSARKSVSTRRFCIFIRKLQRASLTLLCFVFKKKSSNWVGQKPSFSETKLLRKIFSEQKKIRHRSSGAGICTNRNLLDDPYRIRLESVGRQQLGPAGTAPPPHSLRGLGFRPAQE